MLRALPSGADERRFGSEEWVDGGEKDMCITPDALERWIERTSSGPVNLNGSRAGGIDILGDRPARSEEFAQRMFGEYFGNEASCTAFYLTVTLVATVPPAAQRAAVARLAGAVVGAARLAPSAAGRTRNTGGTRVVSIVGGQGKDAGKCEIGGQPGSISLHMREGARPSVAALGPCLAKSFGRLPGKRLTALVCEGGPNKGRPMEADDVVHNAVFRCEYEPTARAAGAAAAAVAAAAAGASARRIAIVGCEALGAPQRGVLDIPAGVTCSLPQLKKLVNEKFGKTPDRRLACMRLLPSGRKAKSTDIVDGAEMRCEYADPVNRGSWVFTGFP